MCDCFRVFVCVFKYSSCPEISRNSQNQEAGFSGEVSFETWISQSRKGCEWESCDSTLLAVP